MYDEYSRPLVEEEIGPGGQVEVAKKYIAESRDTLYMPMTVPPLPPPPPREYFVKMEESYQFIAFKFLKDPSRWWAIAEVNPQIWYPLDLSMGTYLRVPS